MVGGRNDVVTEPNIMRRPAPSPARRPALEWKGLPAPIREPLAEPLAKNPQHNLEKLTRRLEAELQGSPPFRRQRTEDAGQDPIQEAIPDGMAEKDPAR